jgi:DNA polymerase-3 subunit gamma/tau
MRDALSLLDQAIAYGEGAVRETEVRAMLGAIDQSYLYTLLDALARRDGSAMLAVARNMEERSLSFDAALGELALLLHQIALAQTVPEAIAADLPERPQLLELAALFKSEDIQLYYQIALLARRDIGLAPDEYAGFSMSLLRMLAFAPAEVGGATRPVPPAATPPASIASAPAAKPQTNIATPPPPPIAQAVHAEYMAAPPMAEEPLPLAEPEALPAETPPPIFDGNWRGLVDTLKLAGMARMLAQNCALESFDGQRMQLSIPPEHKHLLDNTYQEKLRAVLRDHFGKQLQVTIDMGGATMDTPARQIHQEKATRQAEAEASIQNDPFVRDLLDGFGATIIPSTIKPAQ